ncbi:hypothetical protein KHS38_05710 [Mucilaginibacter sp. Bleaf8]|uniref:hypothetical protein n=1 Tax=Mucilaginibacter sp. Bleaf8 TaxID=2834430 RepID=UPI001BD123CE|nr:hypothetical protein [Mucilaginibacter sp. Bleaf8]MBS7563894.1 hypothetical protein [Mucilaginibacter sp. Bleaf8]
MKKILSVLCCAIMLVATSCKKEYINENNNRTIQFTTTSNSWTTSDGGRIFSTNLDIPEIDDYFQDHGAPLVYISFDNGATYEPISEVYNGVSYSFYHSVGQLIVEAQAYNGTNVINNPSNAVIKVVLIDSN